MAVSLCPASRSSTVEAASTFEPNDSELALGATRPAAPDSTFGGLSHPRAPCDTQWACRCCATTCFSETRAPADPDPPNTHHRAHQRHQHDPTHRAASFTHARHVEKRPGVWYPTPGMSTPIRPGTGEDVNLSRVVGYPAVTGTALVGHGGVNSCGALTMRAGRPVDPVRQPEDDPMGASVVIAAHWRSAGAGDQASLGVHTSTRPQTRQPHPLGLRRVGHPRRPSAPVTILLARGLDPYDDYCRALCASCAGRRFPDVPVIRADLAAVEPAAALSAKSTSRTDSAYTWRTGLVIPAAGYAAPKWTRSASALRGRRTETR